MSQDDEFDYLRERSPEQEAASDDVEPHVKDDDPDVPSGQAKDGEAVRDTQAGL